MARIERPRSPPCFGAFRSPPFGMLGPMSGRGLHPFGAQRGLHTHQTARRPPSSSKAALGPLMPPDFSGEVHYPPVACGLGERVALVEHHHDLAPACSSAAPGSLGFKLEGPFANHRHKPQFDRRLSSWMLRMVLPCRSRVSLRDSKAREQLVFMRFQQMLPLHLDSGPWHAHAEHRHWDPGLKSLLPLSSCPSRRAHGQTGVQQGVAGQYWSGCFLTIGN